MGDRGYHPLLLLLFYSCCFEDELVGKPSALALSAFLFLYCLIIPFTRWHNNNNAYSSNNMIMHRHPHRDNVLHTIAMQIMALHVHTKAEQRPCRAASLSASYHTRKANTHTHTDAQTHHTHTLSVLFGSALYLVFLRVPAVPRPQ